MKRSDIQINGVYACDKLAVPGRRGYYGLVRVVEGPFSEADALDRLGTPSRHPNFCEKIKAFYVVVPIEDVVPRWGESLKPRAQRVYKSLLLCHDEATERARRETIDLTRAEVEARQASGNEAVRLLGNFGIAASAFETRVTFDADEKALRVLRALGVVVEKVAFDPPPG